LESATAVRETPLLTFSRLAVAPGTAAPEESVTVPVNVAVFCWACTVETRSAHKQAEIKIVRGFIIPPKSSTKK
jgi:hypothetical protein